MPVRSRDTQQAQCVDDNALERDRVVLETRLEGKVALFRAAFIAAIAIELFFDVPELRWSSLTFAGIAACSLGLWAWLQMFPTYVWWRKYAVITGELVGFAVACHFALDTSIALGHPKAPIVFCLIVIVTAGVRMHPPSVIFAGVLSLLLYLPNFDRFGPIVVIGLATAIQTLVAGTALRLQQQSAGHALQQSQEQAHHFQSLGVLAGGIAHDLNNLLVPIGGNASYLAKKLKDNPEAVGALRDINEGVKRAADMVKQLLQYSGRTLKDARLVDLNEVVDGIRPLVCGKDHIRFDAAAETIPVNVDPAQVQQVVLNLLTNASDASDGKRVIIRTGVSPASEIQRRALPHGPTVKGLMAWVEVEDRGSGMDAETVDKIFDPFFSTKELGRGLGLSSAIGIARSHGGRLEVHTVVGKGTRVRFWIPRCEGIMISSESVSMDVVPATVRCEVIVIDDEPAIRRVVRRVLTDAGYHVLEAGSCAEAEAEVAQNPNVKCIVLDMGMPGVSGPETLTRLRKISPYLRAVVSSGSAPADIERAFASQEVEVFLQKPWRPDELAAAVAKAVA